MIVVVAVAQVGIDLPTTTVRMDEHALNMRTTRSAMRWHTQHAHAHTTSVSIEEHDAKKKYENIFKKSN